MPFHDPDLKREYQRNWDRRNRPARGETHTTRAGFALRRDRFVAIDGEGYNPDPRRHAYAWLAASDGNRSVSIYNESGLSARECWEFLLSLPKEFGPAIYVGYSLSYDTEFWLPTKPDRIELLDRTGRCKYGPYRFQYWPRKRFEVARIEGEEARVKVDNVYSYFGSSFESAIDDWGIPVSPADRGVLRAGKKRRGQFTRADFENGSIERYNQVELRLLVELVRSLADAREAVGIRSSDFYSPANLAVALFKRFQVSIEPSPAPVEVAAYSAFFGGRIECAAFGTKLGPVWEYDINRAYPFAMASLPDFSNGTWERSTGYRPDSPWSLYHTRRAFPEGWRFYPLPWRASNGAVFYPPRGSGWIWAPEIDPRWLELGWVIVDKAWHFRPNADNVPQFGWEEDVYRQSCELKAQGKAGPAKTLKGGQNSGYGKLAQRVSARTEIVKGVRVRARPTYHNPCYAGLTTSITRARLWALQAEFAEFGPSLYQSPGVIAYCTDAVIADRPLVWLEFAESNANPGGVPVSSEFGALKMEEFDGIQSLQSGVYRTLNRGVWTSRGRGFPNRSPPWDLINEGWRKGRESVSYEVERFVGHRWAKVQPKFAPRTWVRIRKDIRLGAVGKRYMAPLPRFSELHNPSTELYWTKPERDIEYDAESAPNIPDFTRRPRPPSDETSEDLRDLGWEEAPFEERDVSPSS